jgi:hypothetical protein
VQVNMNETNETIYFRYCRTIDGRLLPVDTARRNGRLVPLFSPTDLEPPTAGGEADSREIDELIAEISQDLTAIERRTWLQLVDGATILDIANAEGVSRAAIYERIRGNSKGQGGMIAKNPYVAIWWGLRQGREEGR